MGGLGGVHNFFHWEVGTAWSLEGRGLYEGLGFLLGSHLLRLSLGGEPSSLRAVDFVARWGICQRRWPCVPREMPLC